MKANESDLKQVMADVFGIPSSEIGEESSVDTVATWDSLKHMNLVLALEEKFNISFTEQQTVEILSYPLIKAVLSENGVELTH